jgi:hypothetical protein
MDQEQARTLLATQVERLRHEAYNELAHLLDEQETFERVARDGTRYQVEVASRSDDEASGHLRVIASIDDGGWRAFAPLSQSFIRAPDGSFVGE